MQHNNTKLLFAIEIFLILCYNFSMINYRDIVKIPEFKETYKKIEESKKDCPVNHGLVHINHVISNSKKLSELFHLTIEQENLLLVAATLHDFGYLMGRQDHAENGAMLARDFLKRYFPNEPTQNVDIICKAIAAHRGHKKQDYQDIVSVILILADTFDFKSTRYERNIEKYPEVINFLRIKDVSLVEQSFGYALQIVVTKKFNKRKFETEFLEKKVMPVLNYAKELCKIDISVKYVLPDYEKHM